MNLYDEVRDLRDRWDRASDHAQALSEQFSYLSVAVELFLEGKTSKSALETTLARSRAEVEKAREARWPKAQS